MNFDDMPELKFRYGYFCVLARSSSSAPGCTSSAAPDLQARTGIFRRAKGFPSGLRSRFHSLQTRTIRSAAAP